MRIKLGFMGVAGMLLLCMLSGCETAKGNSGLMPSYETRSTEAKWIRDGEPIEFENARWYPADGVETLLDSEVLLVGVYRDIQLFIDKVDVRPFDRLYTKFDHNKFRYFRKRE